MLVDAAGPDRLADHRSCSAGQTVDLRERNAVTAGVRASTGAPRGRSCPATLYELPLGGFRGLLGAGNAPTGSHQCRRAYFACSSSFDSACSGSLTMQPSTGQTSTQRGLS